MQQNFSIGQPITTTNQTTRPATASADSKSRQPNKKWTTLLIIGIILLILGVAGIIFSTISRPKSDSTTAVYPTIPSTPTKQIYSTLTGETISDASLNSSPTYCIQTPNGTDGARPQAGLTEAKVVFEAIAEAGITRFAAIYQNPTSSVIGPIRSLRLYYLQWDTPFDCTIVHAGGATDALVAVREGNYKDLTENYSYMYRGNYSSRLWNNLFTTSTYLAKYATDSGNTSSNPTGFTRLTPEQSTTERVNSQVTEKLNIVTPAKQSVSTLTPKVATINLNFGGWDTFNLIYNYDTATNTYKRSYASGDPHEVYQCPAGDLGEVDPEDKCTLTQLAPSVVIAMIVEETKAEDNYHEAITTIGSGTAYIFQNGTATKGIWKKSSVSDQIKFYNDTGNEIPLAPGQTWISAIPTYGSVNY